MKSQNKRNQFIYLTYLLILIPTVAMIFLGTKCESDRGPVEDDLVEEATYNCEDKGKVLQLDCPVPPNTNLGNKNPDYDIFAWNTFVAMNWPALAVKIDDDHVLRGIPDLSKSFQNAQHNDLLVWETLAEKREVFNVDQNNPPPNLPSWNSNPHYGSIARVGADSSLYPGEIPGSTSPPAGYVFNTLDETVQVKAEGLEKYYKETNSPAYGQVVAPRVWRGQPAEGNPVRYQVKVNYDFYKYVDQNKFFIQEKVRSAAADTTSPGVRLPYRTSATKGPGNSNTNRKVNYQSSAALDSIIKINSNYDANSTPPLMGAVHIKSAWIRLFEGRDTFSDYHTTTAEYYESTNNGIEKRYATFGLVGLHIIQRIHTNSSDNNSNQIGGTFIFATWEHIKNESDGFTYLNYLQEFELLPRPFGWFPHNSDSIYIKDGNTVFINPDTIAFPVKRKFPILDSTKAVNKMVWDALPAGSVWKNYQLIGTQFKAVDVLAESDSTNTYYNDPDTLFQPQYLANIVIETNEGLQHFQGQPPLTYTIPNFKKFGDKQGVLNNSGPNFSRNTKNMAAGRQAINMGGCMGCHGVAQSEGYSFSFVLLGAYDGAGTDTQKRFDFVPPNLPPPQ